MKPGSLVVVKPFNTLEQVVPWVTWMPVNDEKTIYTIREIVDCHDGTGKQVTAATFEEGIMGYNPLGVELALQIELLIEVQPPEEGENILEQVNEDQLVNI